MDHLIEKGFGNIAHDHDQIYELIMTELWEHHGPSPYFSWEHDGNIHGNMPPLNI